jgi:hypothetical protein
MQVRRMKETATERSTWMQTTIRGDMSMQVENHSVRAFANRHPERPWYQFSLRTLLLIVPLAAAVLGWLSNNYRIRHKENALLQQLAKFFPSTVYDLRGITELDFTTHNRSRPGM